MLTPPPRLQNLALWYDARYPRFPGAFAANPFADLGAVDSLENLMRSNISASQSTANARALYRTTPPRLGVGYDSDNSLQVNGATYYDIASGLTAWEERDGTAVFILAESSLANQQVWMGFGSGLVEVNYQLRGVTISTPGILVRTNGSERNFGATGLPIVNPACYIIQSSSTVSRLTRSYNSTALTSTIGNPIASATISSTAGSIGHTSAGSLRAKNSILGILYYPGYTMSDAEATEAMDWASTAFGLTRSFTSRVVCLGDSYTEGARSTGGRNYPNQLALSSSVEVINFGLSSGTIVTANGGNPVMHNIRTTIDNYVSGTGSRKMVVLAGHNNLTSSGGLSQDAATAHGELNTLCSYHRTAGWQVYVCTIPASNGTGVAAQRSTYNQLIRDNYTTYANNLIDLAADSRMGNASDTTYYHSDGTHLNSVGYGVLAGLIRDQLGLPLAAPGGSGMSTIRNVLEGKIYIGGVAW